MWHKKAIKLEINSFYVVYKPTKDSVMEDVFTKEPTSLQHIINQGKGGLNQEMVSAIFTDPDEAQEYADEIFEEKSLLKD